MNEKGKAMKKTFFKYLKTVRFVAHGLIDEGFLDKDVLICTLMVFVCLESSECKVESGKVMFNKEVS